MAKVSRKRIWGWMVFDWAQQPFYTLGLTFIFGPYFAAVATDFFLNMGAETTAAKAQSQELWSLGQTLSGVVIALAAPIMGAWADASGRKIPWISALSVLFVIASASIWFLKPDGTGLYLVLAIFFAGLVASEILLTFINAFLPSLGDDKEVGRISGSGAAFGYWGGVLSLIIALLFFADDGGKTLLGGQPLFGLDTSEREGTRFIGPIIAVWYVIFMIPFFLWVKDDPSPPKRRVNLPTVIADLITSIKALKSRRSLSALLIGSMFYRDALNALYAYGGVYAVLVLDWTTMQVGVFGIISAIAASIFTWVAGLCDKRFGPKSVVYVVITLLILVCLIIVTMHRTDILGIALQDGLPTNATLAGLIGATYGTADLIFYLCGAVIGGCGGGLYASSRSLIVRHTDLSHATETFGLFALTGKATAFLAPALILITTRITGDNQLGFVPLIVLFVLGLIMLGWVNKDGDRAEWSASSQ